jgi:hypothetical protein
MQRRETMIYPNTEVFRYPNKITFVELEEYQGKTRMEVGKKLDIGRAHFNHSVDSLNLDWFFAPETIKEKEYFLPRLWLLVSEVKELKGLTLMQASEKIGMSYMKFRKGVIYHQLSHLFAKYQRPKKEVFQPTKEERKIKRDRQSLEGVSLEVHFVSCKTHNCINTIRVEVWPGEEPDKRRWCNYCKTNKTPSYYETDAQLLRC